VMAGTSGLSASKDSVQLGFPAAAHTAPARTDSSASASLHTPPADVRQQIGFLLKLLPSHFTLQLLSV
jgi:hypothetical protein